MDDKARESLTFGMTETQDLIRALEGLAVETGSLACLGCGREKKARSRFTRWDELKDLYGQGLSYQSIGATSIT